MTIVEEYLEYTKKYTALYGEKTLVLMQVGSFFECYALLDERDGTTKYIGSQIADFAQINDMAISRKNICVGSLKVVMAGFGLPQLEKYVKRLQEHGYTIAVFTQDNQAKNTTRSLSCIYSAGTFFDGENGGSVAGLSNNTTCVWIHYSGINNIVKRETLTIGISNVDILTGKTCINEFQTEFFNNPTTYDELERFISIYRPSETIIISNLSRPTIESIIQYTNIRDISKQVHIIELDMTSEATAKDTHTFMNEALNCEKQIYQREIYNKFFSRTNNNTANQGICPEDELMTNYYEYCIANQSLCFLLEFIHRHNPMLINRIERPVIENLGNRLILANHSLKQLNIIADNRYTGKLGSVESLLNNAITCMGRRRFQYRLLNPITDIERLNRIYDITEHFLNRENEWRYIRGRLDTVKDLERIKRKLMMGRIMPRDFYNLSKNTEVIREIYERFSDDQDFISYIGKTGIDTGFLGMAGIMIDFIGKNLDLKNAQTVDDISHERLNNLSLETVQFINKGISVDLDNKTKNCIDSREVFEAVRNWFSLQVEAYEKKPQSALSSDYIKIHETSKADAVLMGTKRRVNILKILVEKMMKQSTTVDIKYISKYSNSEETYCLALDELEYRTHGGNQTTMIITSPMIAKLSSYIQASRDILTEEIQKVYSNIVGEFVSIVEKTGEGANANASANATTLDDIVDFVSECDLIQCRCYIADKYNYCRPKIIEDTKAFVHVEKIRHPLIEHLNMNELYVANDLELGGSQEHKASISRKSEASFPHGDRNEESISRKSEASFPHKDGNEESISRMGRFPHKDGMLLYGTNAVGKTSFIKSIGIAVIMAQAGLYVPCERFVYHPYRYIFTRILGNDNIFKGLSTFAVEMSELRTILKQATPNSLIIGDELCSGTETSSAVSIFTAGVEWLHRIGSTFIFATHLHEIVNYREIQELDRLRVCHMSVEFDKTTNTLIYDRKLREGAGIGMYGLEVCKSLDLPYEFLDRAHSLRIKYCDNSSCILSATTTRYNASKIKGGLCEICHLNPATEIHHLQEQKNANSKGIIDGSFHKNHPANLVNICEDCHQNIHNADADIDAISNDEKPYSKQDNSSSNSSSSSNSNNIGKKGNNPKKNTEKTEKKGEHRMGKVKTTSGYKIVEIS